MDQGIDHLVSLSPEKIPPAYAYPKYSIIHLLLILLTSYTTSPL